MGGGFKTLAQYCIILWLLLLFMHLYGFVVSFPVFWDIGCSDVGLPLEFNGTKWTCGAPSTENKKKKKNILKA